MSGECELCGCCPIECKCNEIDLFDRVEKLEERVSKLEAYFLHIQIEENK